MVQIAYENRLPTLLRREAARTAWREGDPALPALYIGHGAPPLFEDALWIEQLSQWADALPVPKGILIVSAHWEAAPLSLSAVATREVVYDFGGFQIAHPLHFTRGTKATGKRAAYLTRYTNRIAIVFRHRN